MIEGGGCGVIGLAPGTLRLVPHDDGWARAFAEARARLVSGGLPSTVAVHHIGSTAVAGLSAKPILDMALAAPTVDLAPAAAACQAAGFADRGARGGGGGHVFVGLDTRTAPSLRTHNLHLYDAADPEVGDHLDFIAALRADPSHRVRYAAVKTDLVARRIPRRDYAGAKSAVVSTILHMWRAGLR